MARKAIAIVLLGVLGYVAAAGVPQRGSSAPAARDAGAWFTLRGKVTRVVDGDTINVRVNRKVERVRLIGVDAPETGDCFAGQAGSALRTLAGGKTVWLRGDRTQSRRDRFGRLLAYVALPNGADAGRLLLLRGYVVVFETSPQFARYASYADAASSAAHAKLGLYATCVVSSAGPAPTTGPIVEPVNPPIPIPKPPVTTGP